MSEGWRMWAISLLTIMLLTLLSAAPIDINDDIKKEDAKADNDAIHSHDENVIREGKFFGHNQFDIGNINVPGSVAGDDVSIGHQVNIDVQGHTHDHHHHEDDTEIKCKEGLREMFKSIDSNKDGLMDVKELLRVCHQNNIQITKPVAVRILTLPDKTVRFNMAKFCELLKDFPSTNSADSIYFLLQLFDKGYEKLWRDDGKCGKDNPLPNGKPAQCDPMNRSPCCSKWGHCGNTDEHCECPTCVNYRGCKAEQFSCSSGDECVEQEYRCDGEPDCLDGSDEQDCNSGCKPDQFSCSSGDECVKMEYRCDFEPDCLDGSDEKDCNSGCRGDQFSCSSGDECVEQEYRCDGEPDCLDDSDEQDCNSGYEKLWRDDLKCGKDNPLPSGKPAQCDPMNGAPCCSRWGFCGNTDEHCECPTCVNYRGCTDDEFSCSSGKCIPKLFRCDGISECEDGSDEIKCEDGIVCKKDELSKTGCSCDNPTGNRVSVCSRGQRCTEDGTCQDGCMPDQFSCHDGIQCVKQEYRCDDPDDPDCSDGSDEKDCNSEKRRKRSTQTLTVSGKIILPANLDFTFPTNSRVYVSCDDISNQQSTNLGIAVIDVSNKPSEEDISYVLEADLPKSKKMTMSATINVGWNRDTNKEWIRKGDFHNDVSYSLYVVKDTAEYEKDISVVLYN